MQAELERTALQHRRRRVGMLRHLAVGPAILLRHLPEMVHDLRAARSLLLGMIEEPDVGRELDKHSELGH